MNPRKQFSCNLHMAMCPGNRQEKTRDALALCEKEKRIILMKERSPFFDSVEGIFEETEEKMRRCANTSCQLPRLAFLHLNNPEVITSHCTG